LKNLLAFPILISLAILQTVIVSRIPLLSGTADVVFLVLTAWALQDQVKNPWLWTLVGGGIISLFSAMPWFTILIGYAATTVLARLLRQRIWQTPILAMFAVTLVGTILVQGLCYAVLRANGTVLDLRQSLNLVILPSVILNMVLALPVHAMVSDLAEWIFPKELEV
jgi:hypothetical protein